MDENMATIPYFAHEGDMNRLERANKRMFILVMILIVALVGSNIAWIVYENQYEDVVTTITQDLDSGDGGDAIIYDGVHINGESEADSNN